VVSADPEKAGMNPQTGIAGLPVHYTDGADGLDEEVSLALQKSFATILSYSPNIDRSPDQPGSPPPATTSEPVPDNPEEVADRLAHIIFNFSRAAAACAPNAKAAAGIRSRILEFVQRGIPIEAQMLWSPRKHWQLATESAIDLAELAAFQTLISIDAAVRTIYRAGMSFVIDLEDIEFQFMEGQNEAQEIYMSGMKRLLEALGLNEFFTLRRMTERAKDAEELSRWRQQIAENYHALKAYWYESEPYPVSSWETLGSFKEIRRLGWKGTLPPEMRRYYLSRIGKRTERYDAEKVDMVLRNLAGVLFHYQFGLLCGSSPSSPLKFSFVRSADAAPAELLHGRIDLRFASRRLCSRVSAAAPWATKGFVSGLQNNIRVSFRGWHELAGARCRFAEGWVTIEGPNRAAKVRADFLRED
jgi:hypothetical protein